MKQSIKCLLSEQANQNSAEAHSFLPRVLRSKGDAPPSPTAEPCKHQAIFRLSSSTPAIFQIELRPIKRFRDLKKKTERKEKLWHQQALRHIPWKFHVRSSVKSLRKILIPLFYCLAGIAKPQDQSGLLQRSLLPLYLWYKLDVISIPTYPLKFVPGRTGNSYSMSDDGRFWVLVHVSKYSIIPDFSFPTISPCHRTSGYEKILNWK